MCWVMGTIRPEGVGWRLVVRVWIKRRGVRATSCKRVNVVTGKKEEVL